MVVRACMGNDKLNSAYKQQYFEIWITLRPGTSHHCYMQNVKFQRKILLEDGEAPISIIRADMPQKARGKYHRHMNYHNIIDLINGLLGNGPW